MSTVEPNPYVVVDDLKVPVPPPGEGAIAWRHPITHAPGWVYSVQSVAQFKHDPRIRLACRAICNELAYRDALPWPGAPEHGPHEIPFEGGYGSHVEQAVREFQRSDEGRLHGLVVSGKVDRATMFALLDPAIRIWEVMLAIPDRILACLLLLESALDPGAQGKKNPKDRGVAQINHDSFDFVTDALAYGEPRWCIQWAAHQLMEHYEQMIELVTVAATRWGFPTRLSAESVRVSARAEQIAWNLAIACHNSPAAAAEWAKTAKPPTTKIVGYVMNVRAQSAHL